MTVMRIYDELFAEVTARTPSSVPIIRYQQYASLRRLHNFNFESDVGRFEALIWFIQNYCTSRAPLRSPFGGRQISWLLSSDDMATEPWPIPRVVKRFLQLDKRSLAYNDHDSFMRMAFWWSTQKSVQLCVEHALVPDSFVDALSRNVIGSWDAAAPLSEGLRLYAEAHPETPWSLDTEGGRLASYIRMLLSPGGVHLGLFVSPAILKRLGAIDSTAAALVGAEPLLGQLRARLEDITAYRMAHARARSGRADICAHDTGLTYPAWGWTSPKTPARDAATPQPARSALPFPVRVIGPINSNSGLGQATRLSIESLRSAGVQVEAVEFILDNPAPRTRHFGSEAPAPAPFAVNILHLNGETLPIAPAFMSPTVFEGAYNVGYFFWEMTQPALVHDLAQRMVDEIWASSAYNVDTYRSSTARPVSHVGMAGPPVDMAALSARAEVRNGYGLAPDAFTFITTFDAYSFMGRKNPAGVLRAFAAAFPLGNEPVRLVVKTHNLLNNLGEPRGAGLRQEVMKLCAADPRVLLVNETLTHEELLSLKSACDVYVSLHRSEGWGFGMLEAMQLGLPPIATAFSGNMDFCTEETTWLVPWTQTYLWPDEYAFFRPGDWWAEPDVEAAAAAMRAAAADPAATRAKGAAARAYVAQRFSPAAIGARYLERLRAIADAHAASDAG